MGKQAKPDAAAEKSAGKSRKPHFKGINHPRNLHKGFRTSGNKDLISAALGAQRRKPAATPAAE